MYLAQEFVNDNSISGIALAFFTALFGMVATITVAALKQRGDIKVTKESSLSTGRLVERKLDILAKNHDRLESQIDDLQAAIRDHMSWHLTEDGKRNGEQQQQRASRLFGQAGR